MSRRTACGLLLAGLGWASLQAQVGLLRELLVAASGSELVLFLGLACWMTGTAAGALAAGLRAKTGRVPDRVSLRVGLLALALAVPAAAVLLRFLRPLAGEPPGALLPLGALSAGAVASLAAPGLMSGWLFVRVAALGRAAGMPLGTTYGLESLGGLAGGLLATLLPAAGLGNLSVILSAGGVAGAVSFVLEGRGRWLAAAPLPLLLLGAAPFAQSLDVALSRAALPALEEVRDTPYGRIALTSRLGQSAVFLDGALAFESQGASAEETVHPPALLVARPERILLLGGLAEGLLTELLKHHPARVDAVELDARGLDLALRAAPPGARESLAAPGVRVRFEDPGRFLETSSEAYDLILCALPDPRTSAANRLWTREAFAAFRRHLRPGGVLAMRLQAPENLWPPLERQRGASLLRSLRSAFPATLLLPGADTLMLASDAPLSRDPALPLARWRARAISTRVVSEASLAWRLRDPRGPGLEAELLAGPPVAANSAARPVCHPLTLALWLSRFMPRLGTAPLLVPPWPAAVVAATLCAGTGALFWAARTDARRTALALATLSGAGGMALQAALLLAFQARHGVLYQDLGLLLTLFMGGMAAGAALPGPPPRRILVGLSILALASALAAAHPLRLPWLAAALLITLAGGAGGALFRAAGRLHPGGAGSLYAADLAGGCAGALLSGLVLPFVGVPAGPLLVAVLALGAMPMGGHGGKV